MESSHFWPSVLHDPLYKTLFLHFWFRPPNAQSLLPKICTKLPITRLVWQIDRRCLGPPGGFRGWSIQWNRAKCCGADPCCHGNEIWACNGWQFGLSQPHNKNKTTDKPKILLSQSYLSLTSTVRSDLAVITGVGAQSTLGARHFCPNFYDICPKN